MQREVDLEIHFNLPYTKLISSIFSKFKKSWQIWSTFAEISILGMEPKDFLFIFVQSIVYNHVKYKNIFHHEMPEKSL